MVDISVNAKNQIGDLVSQFCDYKTPQEYGRSAFWIWYDKIQNEAKSIRVKSSKKISGNQYCYVMKFLGKIFFSVKRVRIKGKFAGSISTITEFQFDDENFYNWLQHQAPVEHTSPRPNIQNVQFKPQPLGFGFTKVKAKSGLFTIADASGKPITKEWFKDVAKMRKTNKGEISTIVNKDGWAYAFYPQRDAEHQLEKMGKSWSSVIAESTFNKAFKEAINEICIGKQINEAVNEPIKIDEDDIRRLIGHTLKRQKELLESIYKPVRYDKIVTLDNGAKIKSLVTISDGAGRYDIGEDDGCYVIYKDKQHSEDSMYIFPELHKELKKLPNLPLH